MKPIALVGAEFEENLSIRYLAAVAEREGFEVVLIPFNESDEVDRVVESIVAVDPLVVGISVPFQLRARELLSVTGTLRDRGVSAHITVGGHFATFEYDNILEEFPGIDSVIRHEGERTFVELCSRVRDGARIGGLAGAAVREEGKVVNGGKRSLPALDELPFPDRRGWPHDVIGVPCSPIVGSRGCYADCSFCCIYAYAENADGARYRRRSPENIVAEMHSEYVERGVRLFIFHDDNFFVPSREKNLERYHRMKTLMARCGLNDVGIVIKCRPNDVDPELFRLLKSMGMIRAYVGIETNSDEGIVSLNRRITSEDNRRALRILDDLDLYCSFNVLIFDPEATLDGIVRNLDFMEQHAQWPFNFCRAEVYAGTPLKTILEREDRLHGDYMAWGYEMREPQVELLFRIATTAFAMRNFKTDGIANLNMGIRFDNEVLRFFYPEAWDPRWHHALTGLSQRIGHNTASIMRDALAFASSVDMDDHGGVKAFTRDLALRVARADLGFLREIKTARRELEQRIVRTGVVRGSGDGISDPVWAAETARLSSSVGRELSTEILPAPSRV